MKPLFNALNMTMDWNAETGMVTGEREGLVISLQTGNETITVNDEEKQLPAAPRTISSVTYVPVRSVSEAAGYEVQWSGAARTVALQMKPDNEGSQGFLWKVENDGNTVYLLGSIHLANSSMYPLRSVIEQAFLEADYMAVELDPTQMDPEKVQQIVMDMAMYQDGTTIADHLSPETYGKLKDILGELELPENAFDQFKPWSVMFTLQSFQAMNAGYEAGIGIDQYFIMKAHEMEKPVIELESIESQLTMLDQFSAELQESLLTATLDAFDDLGQGIEDLSGMWVTGDDDMLLAATNGSAENEEYYEGMLVSRNTAMAEQIEGFLNEESGSTYLVVVGALHMLGDDGIVTLLEEKGFTVIRQ